MYNFTIASVAKDQLQKEEEMFIESEFPIIFQMMMCDMYMLTTLREEDRQLCSTIGC